VGKGRRKQGSQSGKARSQRTSEGSAIQGWTPPTGWFLINGGQGSAYSVGRCCVEPRAKKLSKWVLTKPRDAITFGMNRDLGGTRREQRGERCDVVRTHEAWKKGNHGRQAPDEVAADGKGRGKEMG